VLLWSAAIHIPLLLLLLLLLLLVPQAQSAFHLPRPLELSLAGVKEPEALVDDVDDYNPEVT
jgi:hypothetical protein